MQTLENDQAELRDKKLWESSLDTKILSGHCPVAPLLLIVYPTSSFQGHFVCSFVPIPHPP